MMGGNHRAPSVSTELAEDLKSPADVHQIVTVRLDDGRAVPVFRGSSVITSMSLADGYIEIPEGTGEISGGEEVRVILL